MGRLPHTPLSEPLLPPFAPRGAQDGRLSVFMGVPTMYSYLLAHYDSNMTGEEQARARGAAAALRLTVSGSSACPVPTMERWKQLTGSYLLER